MDFPRGAQESSDADSARRVGEQIERLRLASQPPSLPQLPLDIWVSVARHTRGRDLLSLAEGVAGLLPRLARQPRIVLPPPRALKTLTPWSLNPRSGLPAHFYNERELYLAYIDRFVSTTHGVRHAPRLPKASEREVSEGARARAASLWERQITISPAKRWALMRLAPALDLRELCARVLRDGAEVSETGPFEEQGLLMGRSILWEGSLLQMADACLLRTAQDQGWLRAAAASSPQEGERNWILPEVLRFTSRAEKAAFHSAAKVLQAAFFELIDAYRLDDVRAWDFLCASFRTAGGEPHHLFDGFTLWQACSPAGKKAPSTLSVPPRTATTVGVADPARLGYEALTHQKLRFNGRYRGISGRYFFRNGPPNDGDMVEGLGLPYLADTAARGARIHGGMFHPAVSDDDEAA